MAPSRQPVILSDADACADAILDRVGKRVVLGLPLGIGKATHIANALYARALADATIDLQILTALSLGVPRGRSELERRLLAPMFQRLVPDYPELTYALAQRDRRLPPNVKVHEFFLPAGRRLGADDVQQNFISANYTHIARDLLDRGVNVVAQLLARRNGQLSLSSNTDIALDLVPELWRRRQTGQRIAIAGQINERLPFMPGPAVVQPDNFDLLLDAPHYAFEPFPVPKQPVTPARYAAAFHVATLIEDGGTLQIGIGAFADALTQALKLRQQRNDDFRAAVARLAGPMPASPPALAPFAEGVYACSEMLVDGLLELKRLGIVKRRVRMPADATGKAGKGCSIHAAFFLGSRVFYEQLRAMPEEDLNEIAMTAVSFVNQLYGDEELKREHRRKARFVNNALMATLLGAAVSDGLENGQVISGVGGQYNFVAQAHELSGARSIIVLEAVRSERGRPVSNILWTYGHTTIPRHLRDIVVTEYGIADLRGRSDREVIAAMLDIADSRFQPELLEEAKRAGKIERSYTIAENRRQNVPQRIAQALAPAQADGLLPAFPLGSDMTPVEERLIQALLHLKEVAGSTPRLLPLLLRTALGPRPSAQEQPLLARLGLAEPRGIRERLLAWSVLWALRAQAQ